MSLLTRTDRLNWFRSVDKTISQRRGFTLLEIMMVVALVMLIAGIGYPSYTSYLKKAHRAQAQADLMILAAAMERHKQATYSYISAAGSQGSPANTGAPWVGPDYSPSDGLAADKVYDLTISSVGNGSSLGRSFVLVATPTGSQAGDGRLFYYSTGLKEWDRDNNGSIADNERCWTGSSCL